MERLVSIIVPVYNVENYISKCIESIISQTYRSLEILCIDDGSTDNSGKICDAYALKDKRIKVIHKKNGGVSSARNVGINYITGEFIGFVDPDDWIEPEMFKTLVKMLIYNNVDIAVTNYFIDNETTTIPMVNSENIVNIPFSQKELFKYAFLRDEYKGFGAYIWNKLFKAELLRLQDNSILKFDENIHFCEDIIFFTQLALNSNKIIYTDKHMYHYFHRQSSLSHTDDIFKRIGSLYAYKQIIELLEHTEISRWLKRFYTYHASLILEICINYNYKEKILYFKKETKRYIEEYIETNLEFPDRIHRINDLLENKTNS